MPAFVIRESGPEAVLSWIDRQVLNQREAARKIGIGFDYLNHILHERSNVGLKTALRIERATGIPVEVWDSTDDDQSEPPRRASARKRLIEKNSTPRGRR